MGLFTALFDGVPVRIDTGLAPGVALRRLARLTRWGPGKADILGEASATGVRLYLVRTALRDDGTRFEGRLDPGGMGSVLTGRFVARSSRRAAGAAGVLFAGLLFMGVLLANLMQMVVDYHGLPALLVRGAAMLLGMAGAGVLACVMAWAGSPTRSEIRTLAQALHGALRDDA